MTRRHAWIVDRFADPLPLTRFMLACDTPFGAPGDFNPRLVLNACRAGFDRIVIAIPRTQEHAAALAEHIRQHKLLLADARNRLTVLAEHAPLLTDTDLALANLELWNITGERRSPVKKEAAYV